MAFNRSSRHKPPTGLERDARDLKARFADPPAKEEPDATSTWRGETQRPSTNGHGSCLHEARSMSRTPLQSTTTTKSPIPKDEQEVIGGDVEVVQESGEAPKLSRTMSKKFQTRPPPLFLDWPDVSQEAQRGYDVINACNYANKYLGSTDHAMECECSEEWDASTRTNHACGEDSECINRATKMECISDCSCGKKCQNRRFQRQQYADVSVIKTEKKGYGLRANVDLPAHYFIFEYIGEVIGEQSFRNRMVNYDKEGIKHFYFMSLNKGEFVDATKKGNMGRFCNHSCNPNCYVDKWVVGDKLRMGIFAERRVKAGEELVFNYNVDRYGANPQPCYCGEPNCTGFIGGRTQTERATKLSAATIEALGIEDGEGWDLAVAKKTQKKKKVGEDDEEYVDRVQSKSLDEDGVVKVMATLMQCKEKWIAVKLLSRIQQCDEERVRNRVVKMHGYQILKSQLSTWIEDSNVVLQILYILHRLPRITRNKIQDSGIEAVVQKLVDNDDDRVQEEAASLIKIWSALEMGYRIPRNNLEGGAQQTSAQDRAQERQRRRSRSRSKSRSRSPNVPRGPAAPTGPRGGGMGRGRGGFFPPRPFFQRPPPPGPGDSLPPGWFAASSPNGKPYYFNMTGETKWERPMEPAAPPPPPKIVTKESALDDIIKGITTAPKEQEKVATPTISGKSDSSKRSKEDSKKKEEPKWHALPIEKQKKAYETTMAPTIRYVVNKYKHKLPSDDLKRFAKEAGKIMVESDFKKKKVTDIYELSDKQKQGIKQFTKGYFDRAISKKKEREKRKALEREIKEKEAVANGKPMPEQPPAPIEPAGDDEEVVLSDNEDNAMEESPSPEDSIDSDHKRKREAEDTPLTAASPGEDGATPLKRARSDMSTPQVTPQVPPPPPPPPPPAEPSDTDHDMAEPDQYYQPNGEYVDEGDQNHERRRYDSEGVGLGLKSQLTGPMGRMQMDHARGDHERDEDDDYLVGHWGLDEDDARRLPVRQGS